MPYVAVRRRGQAGPHAPRAIWTGNGAWYRRGVGGVNQPPAPGQPRGLARLLAGFCARLGYRLVETGELERLARERKRLAADCADKRQQIGRLKSKIAEERDRAAAYRTRVLATGLQPTQPPAPPRLQTAAAADPVARETLTQSVRRRAFKRAFGAGLSRDLLDWGVAVADLSPDQAEWPLHDPAAFVSGARDLRERGGLTNPMASEMVRQLTGLGRWAEALDVLLDERCAAPGLNFGWMLTIADCWLALGVLDKAGAAAGAAAGLAFKDQQQKHVGMMNAVLDVRRGGAELSWERACELIAWLMGRWQPNPAAGVLQAYLEGGGGGLDPANAILDVALAILRLADRGPATSLFSAMGGLYERHGRLGEFRGALVALAGERSPPPRAPEPGRRIHNARLSACSGEALATAGDWSAAIGRFTQALGPDAGLHRQTWIELARCVGQDVLARVDLRFRPDGPPKVFDLFPFNGEFEVLRLKLGEMARWVDYFVIVEAACTFSGNPKAPAWPTRAAEFQTYADKIIYVPIDAFPDHIDSPWAREFYQRDSAVTGLSGLCAPDDIVIISDVDEIIAQQAAADFKAPLAGADLRTFRYFLNFEQPSQVKAALVRAKLLARNGCSYLRMGADHSYRHSVIKKAGWHFSYLGAPDDLVFKIRSYSHTEHAHLEREHFVRLLEQIKQGPIWGNLARCDIDESYPSYLRANLEAYARYVL